MLKIEDLVVDIRADEQLNEPLLEKLMMKFEIGKKLYIEYENDFSSPHTTKELSKGLYTKLAISFYLLAYNQNDVRFYNTALKISDMVDLELPTLTF